MIMRIRLSFSGCRAYYYVLVFVVHACEKGKYFREAEARTNNDDDGAANNNNIISIECECKKKEVKSGPDGRKLGWKG